jgi:hypothetical protein
MLGIAVVLATLPVCERLSAGDWPQLLGPARNGVAVGEKLHAAWPTGGPRVVWSGVVLRVLRWRVVES